MKNIEKVEFRPATASDRDFLGEMYVTADQWDDPEERLLDFDTFRIDRPQDAAAYVDNFGKRNGDMGIIAEVDDQCVGAAWSRYINRSRLFYGGDIVPGHSLEIAIAVKHEMRRRGIGRNLLQHLSAMAAHNGHDSLVLLVHEDNIDAARTYLDAGFVVQIGENGREARYGDHDYVPMLKKLK